ncbi:unnamed protein product [Protopolystoma xenopodis]|uniref:Uncharacterized protein n=1 Tax=Protopolystoma xenopodis TaxID=117903 RepID=A0A448XJJ3_9PLAT|nr:unnamed protein product [Protopolystoma xenopodis]
MAPSGTSLSKSSDINHGVPQYAWPYGSSSFGDDYGEYQSSGVTGVALSQAAYTKFLTAGTSGWQTGKAIQLPQHSASIRTLNHNSASTNSQMYSHYIQVGSFQRGLPSTNDILAGGSPFGHTTRFSTSLFPTSGHNASKTVKKTSHAMAYSAKKSRHKKGRRSAHGKQRTYSGIRRFPSPGVDCLALPAPLLSPVYFIGGPNRRASELALSLGHEVHFADVIALLYHRYLPCQLEPHLLQLVGKKRSGLTARELRAMRLKSTQARAIGGLLLPDLQDWQMHGLLEAEPLRIDINSIETLASGDCYLERVDMCTQSF